MKRFNGEGNISTYDLMELMSEVQGANRGKVFFVISLHERGGKRTLWVDTVHDQELPHYATGRFTLRTLFWPSWNYKTFIAALYRGVWDLTKNMPQV